MAKRSKILFIVGSLMRDEFFKRREGIEFLRQKDLDIFILNTDTREELYGSNLWTFICETRKGAEILCRDKNLLMKAEEYFGEEFKDEILKKAQEVKGNLSQSQAGLDAKNGVLAGFSIQKTLEQVMIDRFKEGGEMEIILFFKALGGSAGGLGFAVLLSIAEAIKKFISEGNIDAKISINILVALPDYNDISKIEGVTKDIVIENKNFILKSLDYFLKKIEREIKIESGVFTIRLPFTKGLEKEDVEYLFDVILFFIGTNFPQEIPNLLKVSGSRPLLSFFEFYPALGKEELAEYIASKIIERKFMNNARKPRLPLKEVKEEFVGKSINILKDKEMTEWDKKEFLIAQIQKIKNRAFEEINRYYEDLSVENLEEVLKYLREHQKEIVEYIRAYLDSFLTRKNILDEIVSLWEDTIEKIIEKIDAIRKEHENKVNTAQEKIRESSINALINGEVLLRDGKVSSILDPGTSPYMKNLKGDLESLKQDLLKLEFSNNNDVETFVKAINKDFFLERFGKVYKSIALNPQFTEYILKIERESVQNIQLFAYTFGDVYNRLFREDKKREFIGYSPATYSIGSSKETIRRLCDYTNKTFRDRCVLAVFVAIPELSVLIHKSQGEQNNE